MSKNFEDYLNRVKVTRAEATYILYKRILSEFDRIPHNVGGILKYIIDSKSKQSSGTTKFKLKVFKRALEHNNELTPDMAGVINSVKADEVLQPCPTKQELQKILGCCDTQMRVVVLLAALAGLRIGEIVNLTLFDIKDNKLIIRSTKNHTDRVIPVVAPLARAINNYMEVRANKDDALITTIYGYAISINHLKKKFSNVCHLAGTNYHAHSFRRYFANQFWEASGHNVRALQQAMGHKSVATTMKYLNTSTDEMQSIMESVVDGI